MNDRNPYVSPGLNDDGESRRQRVSVDVAINWRIGAYLSMAIAILFGTLVVAGFWFQGSVSGRGIQWRYVPAEIAPVLWFVSTPAFIVAGMVPLLLGIVGLFRKSVGKSAKRCLWMNCVLGCLAGMLYMLAVIAVVAYGLIPSGPGRWEQRSLDDALVGGIVLTCCSLFPVVYAALGHLIGMALSSGLLKIKRPDG